VFFVYILFSEGGRRTYVGQTSDLDSRVRAHNTGRVKSTRLFVPWKLIHAERFSSRGEAVKREKWFKSHRGRQEIARILASMQ